MEDNVSPNWTKNLSKLTDIEIKSSALVSDMLLKESDRGCAIFGAAILHDDLEELLRSYFRDDEKSVKSVVNPLFEGYAPLATFSSRIQIAFALRLITGDLRYRLDIIRRLRNDFAHQSGPINFDDAKCCDRLRILIAEGKPLEKKPALDPSLIGGQMITREQFVNRVAFIIAVSQLSARIHFLTDVSNAGKDVRAIAVMLEKNGK